MTTTTSLNYTQGGAYITRGGFSWESVLGHSTILTYAFRIAGAPAYQNSSDQSEIGGYGAFTANQITMTIQALQSWADLANITFNRVGSGYSNDATITFGNYSSGAQGAAAFAYLPGEGGIGANRAFAAADGDVWVNVKYAAPALYNYALQALVHEIGHALGLEHPGDYDAGDGGEITYEADAEFVQDSNQYSIMSYFDETHTWAAYGSSYAAAPQLYDIAAIQRLYGANMTTRTGDNVYGFHSNADRPWFSATTASSTLIFAVWDAGGTDTFDFSGFTQNQLIDLQQTHFSNVGGLRGNVSIALNVVIEDAIGGSGADAITGNSAANQLKGLGGADTLNGMDGDDSLYGGLGADSLIGGAGLDTAVYDVTTSVSASLTAGTATTDGVTDTLVSIENLTGGSATDSLIGASTGNVLMGMGGADTLSGLDGSDTLDGGAGADRLDGGVGSDTAVFSVSTAVIASLATGDATTNGETDFLIAIENLTGGSAGDTLSGNGKGNVLSGMAGSDTLSGSGGRDHLSGGVGADVLAGGVGADFFIYDSVRDSGRAVRSRDLIQDLGATDKIDLSAIDANTLLDGDQAFTLIHGRFTGTAGEMRLVWNATQGETQLQADVNGDRKIDLVIRIEDDHHDFSNFVF